MVALQLFPHPTPSLESRLTFFSFLGHLSTSRRHFSDCLVFVRDEQLSVNIHNKSLCGLWKLYFEDTPQNGIARPRP